MYSFVKLASSMMVAVSGLQLQSGCLGQNKRNKTNTISVVPAVENVKDNDTDDGNICAICLQPLSVEPVPSLRDSMHAIEIEWKGCCEFIAVKKIGQFPQSEGLEPWNVQLSCGHVFHRHCLREWFLKKNTCPLCNTEETDVSYETVLCSRSCCQY